MGSFDTSVSQPEFRLTSFVGHTRWFFFVRLPKTPTEIDVTHDGWVNFRSRRGTTRVHVAAIRNIGRGLRRSSVRVAHAGGRLRVPNRFVGFYDFLATVKGMNPTIDIRGF